MGLYLTTDNTHIHASGGIPTRNPSKASGRRPHTLDHEATDRRQVIIIEEISTEPCAVFSNMIAFFSNLDPESGWSERVLSSFLSLTAKCWNGMSEGVTVTWSHIHSNLLFMSHINRRYINFTRAKKIRGFVVPTVVTFCGNVENSV